MSATTLVRRDAVVVGESAAVLGRIVEPAVHLTLWKRSLPQALATLHALDWDGIDDIDVEIAPAALAHDLPTLVTDAGYIDHAQALAREMIALAEPFAAIMDCDLLRLRLEVIETDACRRFHSDNVAARLLMPLVGPGTQWIHAGNEGEIAMLRPGEVGVFKGRLWSEDPLVLHRSPPVAATGETRLLFALNPCDAAGETL